MNKKAFKTSNCLTVYLATTLLLSQASYAGIVGVRGSAAGGSASGGKTTSTVTVKPGKENNEKVDIKEGTASVSCKQDPNASTYFPLDFFQNITREGGSLSFEQRADNKILVKIPASIDTCGKFKPQLYQDPATKNVTVLMQLENGKTYSEYLACLKEKKILKDDKIDHDTIPGNQYSEYSYVLDYAFIKENDEKKTLKLSYGYPKAYSGKDGYASTYGLDDEISLPSSLCMAAEKIQTDVTYLNKGRDALLAEKKEVCMSGNAQKIAEARNSIGKFDALKDDADNIKNALDIAYLEAVKVDVEKLYASMGKIEDRLSKEKDTIDEVTARKLTKQYADLAKDLDIKFLNPAIYRLDTLMKKVVDMDSDDPKKETVDEEIKKLNKEIGAFNDRKTNDSVYAIAEKFALIDSAKTFDDIRAKSFYYSKVYSGPTDARGKQNTIESANKQQVAYAKKFDKVTVDWSDQYAVGKGNYYPIKKAERERTVAYTAMNKRWSDYNVRERTQMQKYCAVGFIGSVKSPVQCRSFQASAGRRQAAELAKRKKDLLYIQSRGEKLARYETAANDYQARKAEEDSDIDEPYSSYSDYGDSYSDRYPASGAESYTPYDPYMYSMGGQSNAMNMGNPNMMMQNPQMQIQPGQFQMPQPNFGMQNGMGGGWPSIR